MKEALQKIKDILLREYPNGFKLEPTTVRLLKPLCDNDWDDFTETELEANTFCRKDNIRLFPEQITDTETQQYIVDTVERLLNEYGCFSLTRLHHDVKERLRNLSDDIADFESFLQFIMPQRLLKITNLEINSSKKVRVVRLEELSLPESLEFLAHEVKTIITEHGGNVSEYDLLERVPVLDAALLHGTVNECLPDISRHKIGRADVFFRQNSTYDVPDDFADQLTKTVEQLKSLDIPVTVQALHTAISLHYKYNFMAAYQMTNESEFRDFIKQCYQGTSHCWKSGVFHEKRS